jgi:hypothetical protein
MSLPLLMRPIYPSLMKRLLFSQYDLWAVNCNEFVFICAEIAFIEPYMPISTVIAE